MNPLDLTRPGRVQSAAPAACTKCGSRVAGICAALDIAGLDEMSHETRRSSVAAREVLFREGDEATHIVMLVRGTAKLSRQLPDGKQQVLGFRFDGDMLGFTTGPCFIADAEMLTDGVICRVSRRDFEAMLARYPVLQRRLIDLCAQELAATQEQLVTVGRRQAEQRVAAFLLSLAQAQKARGASPQAFEMPMTRAEIGDLLGLALETVSRAFSALRRRGLVREPGGNRVELPNIAALQALADGEVLDA
ncbi:MAG: Crp/Fnr family transcriptional regulator [Rhodovarius sp.]|nr:Crp/Fnr family transcriptional regulator [Rhodovarius sp.]MCX7932735.1 Crp/Fnr family transcriptional regulator [Rhodovarius sp.]